MPITVRIEAEGQAGPVLISNDHRDDIPVELRIGEPEAGRTRYVRLTANQAVTIGRALIAAGRLT